VRHDYPAIRETSEHRYLQLLTMGGPVASCGRMLILSWSAELSLCSNWNQLRRRNRTKVAEPASENVMPNWDGKIRQRLTHASLLSLATAFRPDHTAKLPAPAASMTMPAKHL